MKFVCAKSAAELKCSQFPACGGSMRRTPWLIGIFFLVGCSANAALAQQIGKIVPVQAGSDADHAISEINAATDPAQKLALIGTFAEGAGKEGDYPILANGLYVDYYLARKNYDKAFEYGDKLFALDQDNFQNAMNMIRAASEKGDADRLISYGEKAQGILQRYKNAPAPAGSSAEAWTQQKAQTLEANKDGITYIQNAVFSGVYQTKDAGKRAALLARFAQIFADSAYASQALGVAATAYQQAQRSEEHTSELQSRLHLVCRLLLEKKKKKAGEPSYTM